MKILSVRFLNLNSLAGEWMINLQDPSFTSTGIFAITGPTGSGKTTILDAICLALYGQTPRLEKISVSTNEIMTRHTGECFAEVTFESSEGVFRCNWRQKRARSRPEGKLQQPEHEIADAVTNQVLESKIREVGMMVRQVTGMDFEQFTRSMLLAQGGFSAFLEAKPDERAPILEQITGTGIYSDISIKVHERTGEEREKFKALESEIGMIRILTPEEEAVLVAEKEEKRIEISRITTRINTLKEYLDLIGWISVLNLDIQKLVEDRQSLAVKQQEAAPDILRFDIARKAAGYESSWKVLSGLREKYELDTARILGLQNLEGAVEKEFFSADSALQGLEEQYQEALIEAEGQRPLITQVRILDARIEEGWKQIRDIKKNLSDQKKRRDDITSDLNLLQNQQERYNAELALADSYVKDHSEDAVLIERYSWLSSRLTTWAGHQNTLKTISTDLQNVQSGLSIALTEYDEKRQALTEYEDYLDRTRALIRDLHNQINTLLMGVSIGELREQEKLLQVQREELIRIYESAKVAEEYPETLRKLIESSGDLITSRQEFEQLKSDQILHQTRQEAYIDSLETTVRLAARVRDLEEERTFLKSGEPCPLCGSVVHPFIIEGIPSPDIEGSRLSEAKVQLKQINEEIRRLDVCIESCNRDLFRNLEDQAAVGDLIRDTEEVWLTRSDRCGIESDVINREESVRSMLLTVDGEMAAITSRISQYDALDQKIRISEKDLALGNDHHVILMKAEQNTGLISTQYKHEIEHLEKEKERVTEIINTENFSLTDSLSRFHTSVLTPSNIGQIDRELKSRREKYQICLTQQHDLSSRISTLSTGIESAKKRKAELEIEIASIQKDIDEKMGDLSALELNRGDLFGTKDPKAEEDRLLSAIQSTDQTLGPARKRKEEAKTAWDTLIGQIQTFSSSLLSLQRDISGKMGNFLEEILHAGFPSEASFQAAFLSRTEFSRLEAIVRDLENEDTALAALFRNKQENLAREEEKLLIYDIIEHPEQIYKEATERLEILKDELIGMTLRLEEDMSRKEKISGGLFNLEALRRERDRWERLHALIGSADGKKFRVFAQGLTFQLLIAQANRHLQLMTDRYLLRPDPDTPLDLAVIDLWQAGEVRSTRNLSGGESFIVSLALALGLSGMASKNVRVDSLFLDEGFGSLDDEALDTALGALSGLYHQGKLIGIISHVPAIRERISTRIVVKKGNNGRSVIIAPGCTKVS